MIDYSKWASQIDRKIRLDDVIAARENEKGKFSDVHSPLKLFTVVYIAKMTLEFISCFQVAVYKRDRDSSPLY